MTAGSDLLAIPRRAFIPDVIWVYDAAGALVSLSQVDDPGGWEAAVAADAPVITQVDLGKTPPGAPGRFPSSSCSQPSIVADMLSALDVQPGDWVLEIGTGTGWNAALLAYRTGPGGRVVSIEIDPGIAATARATLTAARCDVLVVNGDGAAGYPTPLPYDRIISTASIRETVPSAWFSQLYPGGRLVAPWSTDWSNGVMLTLDKSAGNTRVGVGRFSGDLAFMRLRQQRRALTAWNPSDSQIAAADVSSTDCRGRDLDRMLNPTKALFAIGVRLTSVSSEMTWEAYGPHHHVLELDDHRSRSWARLEADLNDAAPFVVHQFGPRRLWDEAVAAYDWWHDHDEPGLDRFGLTVDQRSHRIWLDTPDAVVREWATGV